MSKRTIAVIIPAHNEERLLGTTLEAVKNQSRPPDEIIVVDNASTDNTAEIAREAGATVVHCARPGVAYARQAGLIAASSDWIVSTDADSLPIPEWLETLEEHMEGNVALYGPMRFFDVTPFDQSLSEYFYRGFLNFSDFFGRPNLAGANMAFSRLAAIQVGGYPAVKMREDVLLGWKLRKLGHVQYVPDALVNTSGRRMQQGKLLFLVKQLAWIRGREPRKFR